MLFVQSIFVLFIVALLCVASIDAAHLRRNNFVRKESKDKELDLIEETRKATAYTDDITEDDDTATITTNEYFACTVAVTAGSMEIEIPAAKDVLTCDRSPSHPLGEAVFEIIGEDSVLETFFQDVDLTRADVTLNVSSNIVNHRGQIDINQHTLDQVFITFTGENRRRELSGTGVDTRNVLVIRVSDDRNRISSRAKVSQTANKLRDDFFAWDNNNLRTIYNRCSNKQLKIKPITQGQAFDGVIDIDLYDLDPNFKCNNDQNYVQLGNEALKHPAVKAISNVDHRIVILPNQGCVDFRGAAAWARVNGDLSWMQSQYAAMPIVQVHEFGHMLGFRHSGTKISETQYKTYGDGTGYMSNKAAWDSEGADMCFNAAKTWYSGWYSQYDEDVHTNAGNFSEKTFRMTHIDDVKNGKSNSSSKVVLRLSNSKSNTNYQHLFVNYNRAKGMNRGVVHHKDKVTIVWQAGKSGESVILSDLDVGQTYTNSTWDSNGELFVHFDKTENNGEVAVVDVKIGGSGYSEPEPGPSDQCVDYKQGNTPWHDADGSYYDCDWYGSNDSYCASYGNGAPNMGKTANSACCVCGGGIGGGSNVSNPRPTPSPTRSPTLSPTRAPTRSPTRSPTPAPTPEKKNNSKCKDISNWYDQDGSYYNCDWYGSQSSHCSLYGNLNGQFNKSANQACCACGGGQ